MDFPHPFLVFPKKFLKTIPAPVEPLLSKYFFKKEALPVRFLAQDAKSSF